MKKLQHFVVISIVISGLLFLFGPVVAPENLQLQQILEKAKNSDVVIIFNSGGWGNTPLERAEDFGLIIKEIQKTFNDWGYNSVVISYSRKSV